MRRKFKERLSNDFKSPLLDPINFIPNDLKQPFKIICSAISSANESLKLIEDYLKLKEVKLDFDYQSFTKMQDLFLQHRDMFLGIRNTLISQFCTNSIDNVNYNNCEKIYKFDASKINQSIKTTMECYVRACQVIPNVLAKLNELNKNISNPSITNLNTDAQRALNSIHKPKTISPIKDVMSISAILNPQNNNPNVNTPDDMKHLFARQRSGDRQL